MALVDFIEESDDKENEGGDADNVRPEALRRGIIIGEGWYKLDLGELRCPEAGVSTHAPQLDLQQTSKFLLTTPHPDHPP